jgi:hypothetical protein
MLPIDRYLIKKSLELSSQMEGKKLIYLDMNYWLRLRDEVADRATKHTEFSETVFNLFDQGKCLFPISNITYYEILKQQDEVSRRNTFDVVTRLSNGITILDDKQRIKLEFLHWIAVGENKMQHTAKELVWSKLPLIIGYHEFAAIDYLEASAEIQDSYFDFMATMPLAEITPDALLRQHPFGFKDNVDEFNANKKLYETQNKTYDDLFLSELGGMLDETDSLFSAAMQEKFLRDTGKIPTAEEISSNVTQQFRTLIYHSFRLNKIGSNLPFFRICADIYASFRWNKDRIYKDGNDTLDVMHAAAALPYCDYFFTERELSTIIAQRNLGQLYDCKVASKLTDVIQLLKEI